MIKEIIYGDIYNSRAVEYDTTGAVEESIKGEDLIADLVDTLKATENRFYLCANEIGYDVRAFAIKFEECVKVFINPMIQDRNDFTIVREVDFESDKQYLIPRFKVITIAYQNEESKVVATKFEGNAAFVVCQALDCLDGIHLPAYGLEVIPEFDTATDEEREAVIKMYLESLQTYAEALDKELRETDEVKDEWNYFRFLKAKAEGKVETMPMEEVEEPKMNRQQRRFMNKLANKLKRRKK